VRNLTPVEVGFKRFLKTVGAHNKGERAQARDFAGDFFLDGCDALLAEADMPADKKALVARRKAELTG